MRMSGTSIIRRIWKDQNLEKTHAQNLELVVVAHPVLQGAKSQGKLHPFLEVRLRKMIRSTSRTVVTSHQFPPSKPRGCKCDPFPRPVPHRRASNTSPEKCRGMCRLNHDHVGCGLYQDVFANDLQRTCWYVFSVFFQFLATKWVRVRSEYLPTQRAASPASVVPVISRPGETSIVQSVCFMDCPVASQNLRKLPSTSKHPVGPKATTKA